MWLQIDSFYSALDFRVLADHAQDNYHEMPVSTEQQALMKANSMMLLTACPGGSKL